jgi:hypothetical protein
LGRFTTDHISCVLCPKGKYKSDASLTYCQDCQFSTTLTEGSISSDACSVCSAGYYGSPPLVPCKPCPNSAGAECPGGTVRPVVLEGYYRISDDAISLCSPEASCLRSGLSAQTPCSAGYSGNRCGTCANNYYKSDLICKECGSSVQIYAVLAVFCIVIGFVVYKFARSQTLISKEFRISMQALQLMALFSTLTDRWPAPVLAFFSVLSFSVIYSINLYDSVLNLSF